MFKQFIFIRSEDSKQILSGDGAPLMRLASDKADLFSHEFEFRGRET